MNFENVNLKKHLDMVIPMHQCSEIYGYVLFPAGKLFRPKLAYATAMDLMPNQTPQFSDKHDISYLASSIEMHHVYTLIHDDLPCMDDDDMRRGRPSAHRQYNEWMAVLSADGLLNASFHLLSKIKHSQLSDLLNFYSWATGPKGLILGQMMDLNLEAKKSFSHLLEIHRLKTSRLIQVAIVGANILCLDGKKNQDQLKLSYRLGNSLGVFFQLIDDLSELIEPLSQHELAVNPWIDQRELCLDKTQKFANTISSVLETRPNTKKVMSEYIQTMTKKMASEAEAINQKTKSNFYQKSIEPIMARF